MADPNLLICVGATKAGTSWLYRYLHDHEECHVRAAKECRYFLTLHARNLMRQLMVTLRVCIVRVRISLSQIPILSMLSRHFALWNVWLSKIFFSMKRLNLPMCFYLAHRFLKKMAPLPTLRGVFLAFEKRCHH